MGFAAQYPLYGIDLSNPVRYLGRRTPHGGLLRINDAATLDAALHAGHFDYVVLEPYSLENPYDRSLVVSEEGKWVGALPYAHLIYASGEIRVFHLDN